MAADDIPAVTAISAAVHDRYAESAEVYAERLALYPAGCFVVERDGTVQGFLITHPWHRDAPPALNALLGAIPPDADALYLHDVALLPAMRGLGAGGAATDRAVDVARRAGLREIMLVAVNGADRFWAAQGFACAGTDTGYGPGTFRMIRTIG
jgi:GNAT superfamily N-acetyltransferase